MKNNTIKLLVACAIMVVLVLCAVFGIRAAYQDGYRAGRQTAIESVEIESVDEYSYTLNFDGEVHEYELSRLDAYLFKTWVDYYGENYLF